MNPASNDNFTMSIISHIFSARLQVMMLCFFNSCNMWGNITVFEETLFLTNEYDNWRTDSKFLGSHLSSFLPLNHSVHQTSRNLWLFSLKLSIYAMTVLSHLNWRFLYDLIGHVVTWTYLEDMSVKLAEFLLGSLYLCQPEVSLPNQAVLSVPHFLHFIS